MSTHNIRFHAEKKNYIPDKTSYLGLCLMFLFFFFFVFFFNKINDFLTSPHKPVSTPNHKYLRDNATSRTGFGFYENTLNDMYFRQTCFSKGGEI